MQEQKLSQDDAKYFTQQQLQGFLEGKFGKGLNYKIRVRASSLHALPVVHTIDKEQNVQYRWIFQSPSKVEKVCQSQSLSLG